jgi:hypothetical protein
MLAGHSAGICGERGSAKEFQLDSPTSASPKVLGFCQATGLSASANCHY